MSKPNDAASNIHNKTKDAGQPSPPISSLIVINNNDWIVEVATAVLAVVGLLQVILLKYTYKASKQNAEAAAANAAAAQKQAATLDKTLIETGKAADAAKQNAETASSAFYAANRPWVLVSNFSIEEKLEGN
jgi:hypothetical protein